MRIRCLSIYFRYNINAVCLYGGFEKLSSKIAVNKTSVCVTGDIEGNGKVKFKRVVVVLKYITVCFMMMSSCVKARGQNVEKAGRIWLLDFLI